MLFGFLHSLILNCILSSPYRSIFHHFHGILWYSKYPWIAFQIAVIRFWNALTSPKPPFSVDPKTISGIWRQRAFLRDTHVLKRTYKLNVLTTVCNTPCILFNLLRVLTSADLKETKKSHFKICCICDVSASYFQTISKASSLGMALFLPKQRK